MRIGGGEGKRAKEREKESGGEGRGKGRGGHWRLVEAGRGPQRPLELHLPPKRGK